MRWPVRLRLTIVFTLAMAVLLTVTGGFLYFRLGAELLRTVDAALLSEADAVAAGLGQQGAAFGAPDAASTRALGSFAQVLGPRATILETTPAVGGSPAVPAAMLPHIQGPPTSTGLCTASRGRPVSSWSLRRGCGWSPGLRCRTSWC